jgi:5-methylcytosine-specific restriction protein A
VRCAEHATRVRVDTATECKAWYDSARWKRLRLDVIREQPFCVECITRGLRVLTSDVDHIVPHRGEPQLFWSRTNLQGLCRPCHTRKTRTE